MSSDSIQLATDWRLDPLWGLCPVAWTGQPLGAAEQQDTNICCPARGPAHSCPHSAAACGGDVAGRPAALWTWPRAQDAGSEPPPGACKGSCVAVIQYLSVCADTQRINNRCFLLSSLFRE